MSNCPFCGSGTTATTSVCDRCGAPLKNTITSVMIDLTGVKKPVQLAVAHAPVVVDAMLPSRLFELSFADSTAVLTYRQPKASKGFTRVVANNGIAIGGDVQGNIVLGNNNNVRSDNAPKKEEPIVIGIFIPTSVNSIIISGNGRTEYSVQCGSAQVTPLNAKLK